MSSAKQIPPTDTVEITNGLTLTPRIKLLLTITRADNTVSPLDEWKLKRSLIQFLTTSFSHPITVPEHDLLFRRFKDAKKRKRQDPVAVGSLFIRDLAFVLASAKQARDFGGDGDGDGVAVEVVERKFLEWRKVLVEKMDGMEVNLEGVKFTVSASVPVSDDFDRLKIDWEEFYAFRNRGYSRGSRKEPDTIILRGLPSRWFAEPRVSSKPSMLVTHTIFSTFGKIRNLNVAEDNDLGKDSDADDGDIISGLQCKVVVQFEQYKDFYNALKALCSRSLQKEGSRMKADYEVSWDKDEFSQGATRHTQERTRWYPAIGAREYKSEAPRRATYSQYDDIGHKRLKE